MRKLFALLIGLLVSTTAMAEPSADYQTISINDSLTKTEKKVRGSAVKITDGDGHGSGGIVQYRDLQLVFTAQHVANGRIGQQYYVLNGSTMEVALLIYADPLHDIAVGQHYFTNNGNILPDKSFCLLEEKSHIPDIPLGIV